jgi:hypothetical protein
LQNTPPLFYAISKSSFALHRQKGDSEQFQKTKLLTVPLLPLLSPLL